METATLTSPPRPLLVQPVQKSLSLPSYAKASGEGIDHAIIFAALEQKEKIRRKSKIFRDKEKCGTTRQNYFCLPLPSSDKCKETSLSSDTSCSSLEFQKPKCHVSPEKCLNSENSSKYLANGSTDYNGNSPSATMNYSSIKTEQTVKIENVRIESRKLLQVDNSKLNMGSSDSMERTERSSKSSNDSISRKERLEAIKARVKAEREKNLCGSSSDEEANLRMTRHNSDGHIHKTVKDVKSKSSKNDKRLRRKTQDEMAIRRALRRQHTSLYIPQTYDPDVMKPLMHRSGSSLALHWDNDEFAKDSFHSRNKMPKELTDPSLSFKNSNYLSDICSNNFKSQIIKNKESDFKLNKLNNKESKTFEIDKMKQDINANIDLTTLETKSNNSCHKFLDHSSFQWNDNNRSFYKCSPPLSRAPTPPPRSPKSIEFVNKAYIQHKNSTNFLQDVHSLERKKSLSRSNGNSLDDIIKQSQEHNCFEKMTESNETSILNRRNKNVTNLRRKTLCNFPNMDEILISNRPKTPTTPTSNQCRKYSIQNFPPRSPDLSHKVNDLNRKSKGYASNTETSGSKVLLRSDSPAKTWEQLEMDREKKFNSLENRPKAMLLKDGFLLKNQSSCFCNNPHDCLCNRNNIHSFKVNKKYSDMFQIETIGNKISNKSCPTSEIGNKVSKSMPICKTPPIPIDRLCKSEANLIKKTPPKTPSPKLEPKHLKSSKTAGEVFVYNSENASENLDSAMKELESIYDSLRISYENLSSINDSKSHVNEMKNLFEKPKTNQNSCIEKPLESVSSNLRNKVTTLSSPRDYIDKSFLELNIDDTVSSTLKDLPNNATNNQSTVRNTLYIEDLFTDLTQQLDLEQKLLEASKQKKVCNQSFTKSSARNSPVCDIPKTSSCTNRFVSHVVSDSECHSIISRSDIREKLMAKRKKEAVDCLSSKISSVMSCDSPGPSVHIEQPYLTNSSSNNCMKTVTNQVNSSKPNVLLESTSLCQKSDDSDSIWQVRVSMSSNKNQINKHSIVSDSDNSSTYSRLRSALRLPRTDSSRDPSPNFGSINFREKSDKFDTSDLEKMLTTLISEIPQTEVTVPSQDNVHQTETISKNVNKGEMFVLQHLDLIRNMEPS